MSFSFGNLKALAVFAVVLFLCALGYHRLIQRSIQRNPDSVSQAVRDHCRYMIGKQLHQLSTADYQEKFQSCDDARVKSIEAAGGLLDPVMVKITLDSQQPLPLGTQVLIFKTATINSGVLSGLPGLSSGRWEFNFYNTYSEFLFKSSL